MKKRKVYLVPHTHWDREWYFTKNTGDTLLHHMIEDIVNSNVDSPMMLDGQFSLLDDYLKWNPDSKNKVKSLLNKGVISSGPLFTQPDVFNSLGETTIRNIEVGKKVGNQLGINNLKTAYLPDTFGFNQNLPQIFKHMGLTNFIFWRGISESQLDDSFYFDWEGIDGSKVKSYNFRKGYFSLGPYYPYNGKKSGKKNDMDILTEKISKVADGVNVKGGPLILPLGGDQAPYLHEAKKITAAMNKKSKQYDFELISNYDRFFEEQSKARHTFKGDLKIPFTGKIHRTISSSRYDIKKAFRESEVNLYYLLEPLEIYYSQFDKSYKFESFKEQNIMKPILFGQAHDSLGGCNTDITNKGALARLEQANNFTMAQVDLLMKKIIQEQNIPVDKFVIFNPAPFTNETFVRKTVYSDIDEKIFIKNKDFSVCTLKSHNISLSDTKKIWKQDVLIYKDNLKPLDIVVEDGKSNANMSDFQKKTEAVKISQEFIEITILSKKIVIRFSAIKDEGDSYDFSPGDIPNLIQEHKILSNIEVSLNASYISVESKLTIDKVCTFVKWDIFVNTNTKKIRTNFNIANKFMNTRLSLEILNPLKEKVYKSQHLSVSEFFSNDIIENWKEKYSEYPAHVDQNDGLIKMGDWNVMTKGTNEIFDLDGMISLTLYRSYSLVTRRDMAWRPSTSGLSFKWDSKDSNLQKNMSFDLEFNLSKVSAAMNEWFFTPYSYKTQNGNFIANKMSKFVINNILHKQFINKKILIDRNIFISSLRLDGNNIRVRLANVENQDVNFAMKYNNKLTNHNHRPYKLKEYILKGRKNEK